MRFLGLNITRAASVINTPTHRGGWYRVTEPFTGAWQRNVEVRFDDVMTNPWVYACITLIASDVAKLPLRLVERTSDKIWIEAESATFSPVLKKFNHYQTRIESVQQWLTSKLAHGNTYALKRRDGRGAVVGIYILDPRRVTPLVTDSGEVLYRLAADKLGRFGDTTVPASEIIHDKCNPLYHPLVGISPIYACGLAATLGLAIEKGAAKFFENAAVPSGILTAPAHIEDETAERLKSEWQKRYSGDNAGNVAILGDGLRFEAMAFKAIDSQLNEQHKESAKRVCSVFHVPAWKIGVGDIPTYNNGELLNLVYYTDCLQVHIEQMELLLDEGLGLDSKKDGTVYGVEFQTSQLMRMDLATKADVALKLVGGGILAPNEARLGFDYKPVAGGGVPYLQQQYFSLEELSKRSLKEPPKQEEPEEPEMDTGLAKELLSAMFSKRVTQ